MIGSGSMLHAIASLKANKRERNHFAAKDLNSSIYTDPIVFRKLSKEMCTKTAKRIQLLKTRENVRLGLVLFVICSVVTTLLVVL
jgi:hypothetical protein